MIQTSEFWLVAISVIVTTVVAIYALWRSLVSAWRAGSILVGAMYPGLTVLVIHAWIGLSERDEFTLLELARDILLSSSTAFTLGLFLAFCGNSIRAREKSRLEARAILRSAGDEVAG
jgi:hypothetical protein